MIRGWILSIALAVSSVAAAQPAGFDLSQATVRDIQAAMDSGALTSQGLVRLYLARISAYDQAGPRLNAVITLNQAVLAQARRLDEERARSGPRSPLHGVVVLAKDVFDTKDMPTSGGFLPMKASQPDRDAFVIDRLRRAGAVVLAKVNQSDWYGVSAMGVSGVAGQPLNPYDPTKSTGGSSSGTGVAMAAWYGTVGLGSDTSGSVLIPSVLQNLVGLSATHGLVSRSGMMWSSPRQENAGPICRSVYDCAAVLDAIAGYDPADLATEAGVGRRPDRPYTDFIDPSGLKGRRVGVLSDMVRQGPEHAPGLALFARAIAAIRASGAVVVDPVRTGLDLPAELDQAGAEGLERAEATDKYLKGLPAAAPIRSLEEMIAKAGPLLKPGIVQSARTGPLDRNVALREIYRRQDTIRAAIVAAMDREGLDVLVLPYRTTLAEPRARAPGAGRLPAATVNALASYTGLPTMVVPGGYFDADGSPFGLQFIARPFDEPMLIRAASGYEAATRHRRLPASTPALAGEKFEYSTNPPYRP